MSPRESFFTVANVLSLSRLPLGLLFAVTLAAPWGGAWTALAVLALAGLTDALDGHFARNQQRDQSTGSHQRVESPAGIGSWLDPICDKVFVATVLLAIWFHSRPSVAVLALILARELVQLPMSLVYVAIPTLRHWLRYDFRASVLGKAATVCQFAAITTLLFGGRATPYVAGVSCVVGLLALGDYVGRAVRLGQLRRSQDNGTSPPRR